MPRGKPLVEVLAPSDPQVPTSDYTNGLINALTPKPGTLIPVTAFQALTFLDHTLNRQCILLYALGHDGIVREFNQGKWNPYPVTS